MKELVRKYRDIAPDYEPIEGIFNDEPDKVRRLKEIINGLEQVDKTLILLYAELGSYRKLAARLGMSHTPIVKRIESIKEVIMSRYYEMVNAELNQELLNKYL